MGGSRVLCLAEHLRQYLLVYIIIAILVAIPIGYRESGFIETHKSLIKNTIVTLAILTLLPSMIQLRVEKLGGEFTAKKVETLTALLIIFGVGPLTAMAIAGVLPGQPLSIGFVAANSVPASSASIAYVLLAEGNIELATLLAIISVLGAVAAVPLYVGLYARSLSIQLPLSSLAESVSIVLLTPLIVGQVARYFLVKRRARGLLASPEASLPCKNKQLHSASLEEALRHLEDALECVEGVLGRRLKPYLSLWTILAMLALIATLIAAKSRLLVEKPVVGGEIIGLQLVVYAVVIAALALATKALRLRYEDHAAIAFISLTKNESVAAAVSVMAIGATAALPAALVPTIQPIIAIFYLWALPILAKLLAMPRQGEASSKKQARREAVAVARAEGATT